MATITTSVGIYKITNKLNGKCYIGQSVNIKKRWEYYKYPSNAVSTTAIIPAILKYGVEGFSFEIVEECSKDQLNEREIYWIRECSSLVPNGYNLTSGGNAPTKISEISKEKMRAAKLGTVHSEETICRRRESFAKVKDTTEYRTKLSEARKSYVQSAETIRKRADAQIGKDIPIEQRINMARAHMNGRAVLCSNGEIYMSVREAADACGVHTDSVLRVCSGKYKQAKGYSFKYIEAP